jgi:hypothetical protein
LRGGKLTKFTALNSSSRRPLLARLLCFGVTDHYIRRMAKEHPHAGASYRIVTQENSTYGVEVIVPGSFPALVTSFATEESAEAWITGHKRRVEENVPRGFMRARGLRSSGAPAAR